jgi:tripartite-type tricarboxylate transporter receptor subunit TctC
MRTLSGVLTSVSLALGLMATPAMASDDYPNRTVRIVLPFSPGGGADNNARIIAGPLSERLGHPVVIDYKPGAGGTIAANYVARAAKDGYTILYATPGQQMTNPHLMDSLPYDPDKDFDAIIQLIQGTNVLVVNKDLAVNNVAELIAYAKKNPGKITFASSGIGSSSHLAGELFKSMAGIDIRHIPFKGSGQAVAQVLGGQVPMTIDTVSVYQPHIKSGAVKALGISTLGRNPTLPDVAPIGDTLTGFSAFPVNYLTAPAGTPRSIIDKLNREMNAVLQMPSVQERFLQNGSTVIGGTPQEMDALVKSESAKWKKVIDASKASAK